MLVHHAYVISLRVRHPEWPSAWIAASLELQPKVSRSVGEPRFASDGRHLGINRESFCTFDIGPKELGWFTEGMARLLGTLGPREAAIQEIRKTGGVVELFVGVFVDVKASTGFVMEPDLLADLARLGVQLSVEIY
ncbi:hypothetical protein LK996_04210 [Lysobacter sp. A6]|uniref:DUF4279 domain-containing protein n=1 Tax=Noviluteimonas lactosilytica TaxID=2888523 RepID=A0ABS8JFA1_9GAMM|nr:hypothetical protein [Lysobacter lactosilyticus]MCC8362277.1 hypothetical protein [Lysobacter lactosilyticus]